jgi:predicted aldo/keto reductase-like oxidoreductase
MKKEFTRREFIRTTVGAGIAAGSLAVLPGCEVPQQGAIPKTVLGKTGMEIPRIAIGMGSRYCAMKNEEEAEQMLYYALDHGLNYWDTAHSYENKDLGVVSEERLGRVLKSRRKEVIISTKVQSRDPEEAKARIEKSLQRLQIDKLDILKIHNVQSLEDVEKICEKGGVGELAMRMKEEGITRFVGFSGHSNAAALRAMIDRFDFDTVLMALNHYGNNEQNREEDVAPYAKQKGMGVMVMKAVRPKENINGLDPGKLIRYALTLDPVDGVVIGMDSMKILKKNIELLHNYKPLEEGEMHDIQARLAPFFRHEGLDWMQPGYEDGHWMHA